METNEIDTGSGSDPAPSRTWKPSWLAAGALAAGLAVGAAGIAGAATGSGSSSTSTDSNASSSAPAAPGYGQAPSGQAPSGQAPSGARPDPASMPNGPGETVLTGDDATKATDAALAAVPGATVIRVETDSSGVGTYEAHLKKSDGSQVTVLMDANFKVTSTVDGFGGGPKGQDGRDGRPPQGAPQSAPQSEGGETSSN
jgi:hypothetical protein